MKPIKNVSFLKQDIFDKDLDQKILNFFKKIDVLFLIWQQIQQAINLLIL